MNILSVVVQILILLMLAACGLFLRKKQIMTDVVIKGVNNIVLTAAWPMMILMSTQKDFSTATIHGFWQVLLLSILFLGGSAVLLYILARKRIEESKRAVFVSLSAMPNSAFVGMPIIYAFYGDQGLIYSAAYMLAFNLLMWSLYVFIFGDKKANPLKNMLNTGTISVVVAMLLFVLRIRIPEPFAGFCNQMGSLTTPLAMLLMGARTDESLNFKKLGSKTLWSATVIRLVLFPLAIHGLMRLMGFEGMILGVMVLGSAMPAASATQMLAERYDKDYHLAAQGISVMLVLCLVTIPLILLITGI